MPSACPAVPGLWLTLGTSTRPDPRGWLVLLPKPQPCLSQDLSWTSGDVVEAAAGTARLAVLGHCGLGSCIIALGSPQELLLLLLLARQLLLLRAELIPGSPGSLKGTF